MARWIRVNERTDILISLDAANRMLTGAKSDPGLWKWAVVALHNSIQGAMACHLSGTAQVGALDKKSIKKFWSWTERDRRGEIQRVDEGVKEIGVPARRIARAEENPPIGKLAPASELFERLREQGKRTESRAGAVISVSEEQVESFKLLNQMRNEFVHFTLKHWSIEISGLPKLFLDMVELHRAILLDPWPYRHMSQEEKTQLQRQLNDLEKISRDAANWN